ncbi:MAG: hypothetical protein Q4C89_00735 [Deinococcus sp.]|uniref:hypothetical protein n=1 Tax=Deinococcus sp. TaxID=47478 RepID=UPI0026DD7FEC|nr:hypothetical protein [Deinococcus sp.]MDO4244534.1 hypothetical protein [Deinococcus sp.]
MPPRLEAALLAALALWVFWATVSYANHMVANAQAGRWVGAVVDGAIWLGGVLLVVLFVQRAWEKWK